MKKLVKKFEEEETASTDFDGCNNERERVQRMMLMIPRIGVTMKSNVYTCFGFRKRQDDDADTWWASPVEDSRKGAQ